MTKVLWVTDLPANGSGYSTISKPICSGLVERGYEVKVLALQNRGEEHWNNFSVIPVETIAESFAALHNLNILWKPDVLVVALDIPIQQQYYQRTAPLGLKYIAINPLENGPLLQSWAGTLMQLDDVFFISELGKREGLKAGVEKSKHLLVGLNPDIWRPAEEDERSKVRKNLGFAEDEIVILTVADNQERKNLWAGMKIVSNMKQAHPEMKIKYVLVTREHTSVGYALMEMAFSLGLQKEIVIFERGMPNTQLRLLYISCDAYLQPSKAEGLCLPIMEAMACGAPVVGTDTGAIHELLMDGRGYLVEGYKLGDLPGYIDVWGNSLRTLINIEKGTKSLSDCICNPNSDMIKLSIEYINSRTPDMTLQQIIDSIERVTNGK